MIIFGTCVGPDQSNYERVARPSIERIAEPHDLILTAPGEEGICRTYNEFLDVARETPGCQGLVLIHDDVSIIDANFRGDLVRAFADTAVAVVGVAGGADLRSLAWWHSRRRYGALFESRGYTKLGPRFGDVDAVDGCVMGLSPAAIRAGRFDEVNFPKFHGYDADFCLQMKDVGLRVAVLPLDVAHRTKGGYGDRSAFNAANDAFRRKWPQHVRTGFVPVVVASAAIAGRRWLTNRGPLWARKFVSNLRSPMPDVVPAADVGRDVSCPICHALIAIPDRTEMTILECEICRVGLTWPPPDRDVEGEGLFKERYGGMRLLLRQTWDREARLRTDWLKLYLPDGCVLEVGAATGEFVLAAENAGYDAYGIEVSEWAASHARRRGADVATGYLADWIAKRPGVRPDAIAMWHVLEHLPEPKSVLSQMAELMGTGGLLVLEVPNFGSLDAQRLGVKWDAAQPLDHFHHFREDSLREILEQSGFQVEHTLPISRSVYLSPKRWNEVRNEAALDGRFPPPVDLLRAVARVGSGGG